MKKMVVFDIDGTITSHVSSWRYIHERLGLWDVLAKKYQDEFLAGKISYRRFCQLDAAHWKGIKESRMREVFEGVKYSKNAEKVIRKLKSRGYRLAAVSTGLQFVAEKIKRDLGFDMVVSNRLNVRKGVITGGVTINISHGAKGIALKKMLRGFDLKPSEMIAVGDSEGDIPMMELAGYSIAFNSCSEKLSRAADYVCKTRDFMEVYRAISKIDGR
ncbi:MAG TPA: HAD family phosphatase [Candidatus Omnitrophota bacterium]|nr:HAD family phosphatase [Candidatus Omnitrophota bacterium]